VARVLVTGKSGTGTTKALFELGRRRSRVPSSCDARSSAIRSSRHSHSPSGKNFGERELIPYHLESVEPLPRATCTHVIDRSRPLEFVVDALIAIGTGIGTDRPSR
jgi:hypothetical protein